MLKFSRIIASRLFQAVLCACLTLPALAQISVRSVRVMGSKDTVEIEVEASDRIVPETQVLTGPDRLVIDFPNAVPSNQVRNQSVDRGEVKDVRVGLFQSRPPVTRVVLDLKSARSYQVFPYGRTVMIKIAGDAVASTAQSRGPAVVAANYTAGAEPVPAPVPAQPPLQVTFRDGLLAIHANKATLSQVLFAVQQRTGADIAIPAGAEQEQVVAEIDPAPAPEVLARLLNGSSFNFMILSAPDNPNHLDRVILSNRGDVGSAPLAPVQAQNDPSADDPSVAQNQPNMQPPPQPSAEGEARPADNPPNQ
jgi:hypothetical protein